MESTPEEHAEKMKEMCEEYRRQPRYTTATTGTIPHPSPYISTSTTSTTGITDEQIEAYKKSMSMSAGVGGSFHITTMGTPTTGPIPPYPGGEARKKPLVLYKYGAAFIVEEIRGKLRCTTYLCHDDFGTITAYGPDDKPENAVLAGMEKLRENYPEWGEMVDKLVTKQMTGPTKEEPELYGLTFPKAPITTSGMMGGVGSGLAGLASVGNPYMTDKESWYIKKP